jgi:hypothetical protein
MRVRRLRFLAPPRADYDNCFFRDPARAPAMCSGDGGSACIDDQHRKIVSYRKFSGSDYADYSGGHGTHVCGSVAGSAAVTDAAQLEFASQVRTLETLASK